MMVRDWRPYLFCFVIILGFSVVLGDNLTCQYKVNESYEKEVLKFYYNSSLEPYEGPAPVEHSDFVSSCFAFLGCNSPPSFKVTNNLDYDINVTVLFAPPGQSSAAGLSVGNYIIPKKDYIFVKGDCSGLGSCSFDPETVKYQINDADPIISRRENATFNKTVCKTCLDKFCLNDGENCSRPQECGSGFCIKGYCSASEVCFNNDCKCGSDEVQCTDNKRCVKKASVPLEVKPSCDMYQECVSNYINTTTGLCVKSPAQMQKEESQREEKLKEEEHERVIQELENVKEERNFWIVIVFLILLFLIIIGFLKIKKEKEAQKTVKLVTESTVTIEKHRQATIDREVKAELEKLQIRAKRITDIERELSYLEDKRDKTREELNEIEALKREHIYNLEPFSYSLVGNRFVVINPYLGGYLCFYQSGLHLKDYTISTLVHRWIWEKRYGRKPKFGYHIHHKNKNKYDNRPENLEEVYGKDHFNSLHHRL